MNTVGKKKKHREGRNYQQTRKAVFGDDIKSRDVTSSSFSGQGTNEQVQLIGATSTVFARVFVTPTVQCCGSFGRLFGLLDGYP